MRKIYWYQGTTKQKITQNRVYVSRVLVYLLDDRHIISTNASGTWVPWGTICLLQYAGVIHTTGVFLESFQITHKRLYIMHDMPLIITHMNVGLHCDHCHKWWCKVAYHAKISALMFISVCSYLLHVKHTISFPQIFNPWDIPYLLLVDEISGPFY